MQEGRISTVIVMSTNFSCGSRIKELRTERGLSQEHLALNADITPAYLGLVERGKKNATVTTIERLCIAMDISLADFFSPAEGSKSPDDEIGQQILHQLSGMSNEEKLLFLQLVKDAVHIRQTALKRAKK